MASKSKFRCIRCLSECSTSVLLESSQTNFMGPSASYLCMPRACPLAILPPSSLSLAGACKARASRRHCALSFATPTNYHAFCVRVYCILQDACR